MREVAETLRSGWLTAGPKVKLFEERFATYVGASNAVAVNSCTAGLEVALAALGVGPGDEVIVPTLTFCSTANVVVHRGARPVLVDVGPDGNVTPEAVDGAISSATKAIIPVHYGGQPCDLEAIYRIAEDHGVAVLEDAAHVAGATYRASKVGSDAVSAAHRIPRATVFSFYATKTMTTGEGGMITTPDEELARLMRRWANHGMDRDAWSRTSAGDWYYEVVDPGYKANMTDLQAALGIRQLERLDDFALTRQRYANLYDQLFAGLQQVEAPLTHPDREHVYYIYSVRLALNGSKLSRRGVGEALRDRGIGTSVHFIPVHLHPFYQRSFGYRPGDLPGAEELFERLLSLPLYPRMTDGDVHYVADTLSRVLQEARA